jgi:hypothetical protein
MSRVVNMPTAKKPGRPSQDLGTVRYLRLDTATDARVEALSIADGRTVAETCRRLIRSALAELPAKSRSKK